MEATSRAAAMTAGLRALLPSPGHLQALLTEFHIHVAQYLDAKAFPVMHLALSLFRIEQPSPPYESALARLAAAVPPAELAALLELGAVHGFLNAFVHVRKVFRGLTPAQLAELPSKVHLRPLAMTTEAFQRALGVVSAAAAATPEPAKDIMARRHATVCSAVRDARRAADTITTALQQMEAALARIQPRRKASTKKASATV